MKLTLEVAVPMQGDDPYTMVRRTLDAANAVKAAIGDAGECIDSGMGGGARDMGFATTAPAEVLKRARAVAPEGTTYAIRQDVSADLLRSLGLPADGSHGDSEQQPA